MKNTVLDNGKIILKDSKKCPFCKNCPEAVVMPSGQGFCALIQCNSNDCQVNPSTHLFQDKTKQGALLKARKAWEKRKN